MEESTFLVTGINGFICSALTDYLCEKYSKIKIIGIDRFKTQRYTKRTYHKNVLLIKADLLNVNDINSVFDEYKIDVILHFAACTHVDTSFNDPILFTQNNIIGTHILLENARKHHIKKFIYISTDEVYSNKHKLVTEESVIEPRNPYSASKAACENIVVSYHHSFKVPTIIVRCSNVYGPGQYPDRVISRFCGRLLRREKCQIHGSGKQLRSFLYIEDAITGLETVVLKGKINEIYNLSSETHSSVLEVLEKIVNIIHQDGTHLWIQHVQDREENDKSYITSSKKLRQLGWTQQVNLDEGLKLTIRWYKDNLTNWSEENIKKALMLN